MARKAVSQVDFAIASGLFIMLFAFLVLFSTDYFSTLKNDATLSEKRGYALGFLNDILGPGDPVSWERLIITFGNNTAANWSRSFVRTSNATIRIFSSGELSHSNDENYSYVNTSESSDGLELTFPQMGINTGSKIGYAAFMIFYNATEIEQQSGEGNFRDDLVFFSGSSENYLDDWSNGTAGELVWWNSGNYYLRMQNPSDANSLKTRLYYNPSASGIAYFDAINFSVNYSYYPYYPRKLGLFSDSYYADILLNNTIVTTTSENVTVNFTALGYDDADMNSVIVYNESGSVVSCNLTGKLILFQASINNGEQKWFKIWFSRNSTSNFSTPCCNSVITGGTDNLTTSNRNETIFPAQRASVMQYSKILALNSSLYEIMKQTTDVGHSFHITVKNSSGSDFFDYGESVPRKGDISAFQRSIVYQNSTAGINYGTMTLFLW